MLGNKRSHHNMKPAHHKEEQALLAATRESPEQSNINNVCVCVYIYIYIFFFFLREICFKKKKKKSTKNFPGGPGRFHMLQGN